MAAAAIPLATAAVSAIAPFIPQLVQMVEDLFGHSSKTGQQTGEQKMQTVVTAAQALLTAIANAGKVPSASVLDPSTPAAIAGAAQQVVTSMKAAGLLNGQPATTATIPAAVSNTTAPITITGTFQLIPVQKA